MSESTQPYEQRIEQASTAAERVDALNALANVIRRTDVHGALRVLEQASALARDPSQPYPRGLADNLLAISRCNNSIGQNEVALAQAAEAMSIYQRTNQPSGQLATHEVLGNLYNTLGEHSAALGHLVQGLALAEQCGDHYRQVMMPLRIGMLYSDRRQYAEAFPYYDQALALCQGTGDLDTEARILNSYCVDSTNVGDYARALEYGLRSQQRFEAAGNLYGQGVALGSIGEAHVAAGQYAEALVALQRAIELLKTRGDVQTSYEAVCINYQIGVAYLGRRELDLALRQLQETLAHARAGQIRTMEYQCHERLAELFELRGDLRQALEHYRQFHAAHAQMFNEASDDKLKNLEVLHRTRQAQAEAERQRQLREDDRRYFEQLALLQHNFFSTTTHDLKNPLNTLHIGIELLELQTPPGDGDTHEILAGMRRGIGRMSDLIADILDLAKLETGRALDIQPLALAPVLRATMHDHQLAAGQKQLDLELQADLGDAIVECDLAQFRRALDNLVGNAIKYTPAGGRVVIAAERAASDLIITIADTGVGISAQDLPHLFERFYRVRDAEYLRVEGTGLGLAIVKAIVEQHGGAVWAESAPGRGSAFHVRMPLSLALAPVA